MIGQQAGDAGTVTVRVQVVDVESGALDLVVPTYLPAKDVTQRIARDANLGAYWPDGTRRTFWIRARGRLLGPEERLQDLGIVPGELIHILPQPPEGSAVIERPPELPHTTGYRSGSMIVMIGSGLSMMAYACLWALGLTVATDLVLALVLGFVPAVALALLCVSIARHLFGPPGSSVRIPLVAFVAFLPVFLMAYVPAFLLEVDSTNLGLSMAVGFLSGVGGLVMGWLAWYGAVEPLPERDLTEADLRQPDQVTVAQCAICGQNVDLMDMETRYDCGYGCGRVFHQGCYRARAAISREGQCAVCGYEPGAQAS